MAGVRGARGLKITAVVGCAVALAGCTTQPPVLPDQTPSDPPVTAPADPWGQLAARVAASRGNRYVAAYTLATRGRPERRVTVTVAADASWLIIIPDGALGGTADIALANTPAGLYECAPTGCVKVGPPDTQLPSGYDPRVQHVFTDWLKVLTNRAVALSVEVAAPLPGSRGRCFSIEANSAALGSPVDPGVYCYDDKGTLTAAALGLGNLTLTAAPAPAPATVSLPGPVVSGMPLPMAAPPSPTASPSVSPSRR